LSIVALAQVVFFVYNYFNACSIILIVVLNFSFASHQLHLNQPAYAEASADGINFCYRYSLCQKKSLSRWRKALFKLSNTIPPGYSLVMTIVMTTYDKAENFMLVFFAFK
jgi:hypothetical protein